jgi:hypothetical protein
MGRASTEMARAQKLFQDALNQNVFSADEMKAMLLKASRMMNQFEMDNMVEETNVKNFEELYMMVN